jgi:hypothetical protein
MQYYRYHYETPAGNGSVVATNRKAALSKIWSLFAKPTGFNGFNPNEIEITDIEEVSC